MTERALPESSVAVNFDGALLSVAVSLQQKGQRMHQQHSPVSMSLRHYHI